MRVSVTMNNAALNQLSRAQATAASQTASELINRVRNANVMPFDVGTLQNESTFVDDRQVTSGIVSIIHDTPYAARLYFNPQYNFQQGKNANARGEWWEDWINGRRKNEPAEIFKKLYAKAAGGFVR